MVIKIKWLLRATVTLSASPPIKSKLTDGYLFRTARRKTGQLTTNPLFQQDAHRYHPPVRESGRPSKRGLAITPSVRPARRAGVYPTPFLLGKPQVRLTPSREWFYCLFSF
jgi:hypothetical protein